MVGWLVGLHPIPKLRDSAGLPVLSTLLSLNLDFGNEQMHTPYLLPRHIRWCGGVGRWEKAKQSTSAAQELHLVWSSPVQSRPESTPRHGQSYHVGISHLLCRVNVDTDSKLSLERMTKKEEEKRNMDENPPASEDDNQRRGRTQSI